LDTVIFTEPPEQIDVADEFTVLFVGGALTVEVAVPLIHFPVAVCVAVMLLPAVNAVTVNDHTPPVIDGVPSVVFVVVFLTVTIVPSASKLVPLIVVEPEQSVFITGVVDAACTVTGVEAGLTHLLEACAVAVITSFAASDVTVLVHVPPVIVALPTDTEFLNTVTVPVVSVVVPLTVTVVVDGHSGPLTTGATEIKTV